MDYSFTYLLCVYYIYYFDYILNFFFNFVISVTYVWIIIILWFLGAFRVEMQRENQKDRTILCKFDPTEPGDYRVEVKWAGEHVPGSPFMVMIFDTQEELNRFLQVNLPMMCDSIQSVIHIVIHAYHFWRFIFINFCFVDCFRVTIHQLDLIYIVVLITHQVMLISHLKLVTRWIIYIFC